MKKKLTVKLLMKVAENFCKRESGNFRKELFGVTDGKTIGTFVEHLFQTMLNEDFDLEIGSSATGLDLPSINTDIKVTSIKQPQSSCPFKDSKQKIYGLGYNLIVFVYEKEDDLKKKEGCLHFRTCAFIKSSRTGDYQTTTEILRIIKNNGNADDLFAFLNDRKIPADEVTLMNLANDLLKNPPEIGYLTISNALQWRLQYGRVINLEGNIKGIISVFKSK